MSQESQNTGHMGQSAAEMDRIRDIIFGPQMRNYEQQFKRLASQLDQVSSQVEELRAALEEQRLEQETRTNKVQEAMRQALDEARSDLSIRLEQQGTELKAETRKLASDFRKQAQDLRSEFAEGLHALEDDKASRLDVGDLLIEMGTRLKQQVGLADLLGELEGLGQGNDE